MNTICLSESTNIILKEYLRSKGCDLIEIRRTDAVYEAISSHCDIYLCKIRDEVVVASVQLPMILTGLQQSGVKFTPGAGELGLVYPENVKYNAVQIGNFLVHNTGLTDPVILETAQRFGMELLHVKQGYTKCSLVVVDDRSAITSDPGVASALEKHGINVLAISRGHVVLQGFPYGFLGGASGRIGDEIIFNGDLSAHPDFKRIQDFIGRCGLQTVYFKEYPLEDIGSIIQV